MSDFLQSRVKKAAQTRTDDAYWKERSQFQSPQHRDAFEKWFEKEYGGAIDVGYYRTGRRNEKLRLPTPEEYYTAKNQFDYDSKGLYPDLNYDPFRRDKLENEAWKTYLKTHGYQNFDESEFQRTYNRIKYKDQYDMSIDEDIRAYEVGDKPYRYQMSEKAANEFKQLMADIDNGTLGQSWREKYKTLAAYDAYALNAAKEAAAAKAREEKRRQDALDNGEPYVEPFTSPLEGTKKAKASPIDVDTLKRLGWDENTGFSWIDRAIIERQQAINDRAAAAREAVTGYDGQQQTRHPTQQAGPRMGYDPETGHFRSGYDAATGTFKALPIPRTPMPVPAPKGATGFTPAPRPAYMGEATMPTGGPLSAQGQRARDAMGKPGSQQTIGERYWATPDEQIKALTDQFAKTEKAPADGKIGWNGDSGSVMISTRVDSKLNQNGSRPGRYVIWSQSPGKYALTYMEDGKTFTDAANFRAKEFNSLEDAQKYAQQYATALLEGRKPPESFGDIAGAAGKGALQGLNLPQSAYLNTGNIIHNIKTGHSPFYGAKLSMTLEDFSSQMTEKYGGPDLFRELDKAGIFGELAGQSLEVLSDPTNYVAGGAVYDLLKAKGMLTPANLKLVKNTFLLDENAVKNLTPTAKDFARADAQAAQNADIFGGIKGDGLPESMVTRPKPTARPLPRTNPMDDFTITYKDTTTPNVRGVDDLSTPTSSRVMPASSLPEGATARPLSSVFAEDDLARQLDRVDSYVPNEHVRPYKNQAGQTHYELTDINGSVIGRYRDPVRAANGANRYKEALYQAIDSGKGVAPVELPGAQGTLYVDRYGVVKNTPIEPRLLPAPQPNIASDNLGNRLRGITPAEARAAGGTRMPTNARMINPRSIARATIDNGPTVGKAGSTAPDAGIRPTTGPRNVAAAADDVADITLTQKVPPAGGANPTIGPSQRFETSKPRMTFREKLNRRIRETLDPQQGVKNIGDDQRVYRSAINSKNVGTQIGNIMERELVGMDGRRIGDSLKKVLLDNVPEGQELEFWEYALQKHNIARANAGKPIFSQLVNGKEVYFSAAESAARVKQIEALHPDWASKAKNITKWLDTFMQEWGVKAGTVDAQAYKDLRLLYEDYLPTNRAFSDLEDFIPESGVGRGFIDKSSPIKTATGSQRNIIDPSENIINLVNRTVRTARLNEVGQLLVDAIKKNPQKMKAVAEIVPRDVANVDNVMQVLVKGKPVFIKINDIGVMDTLTKLNEIRELSKLGRAVGKMTGFIKSAITTNNPLFGILNGFRDVQTYLSLTQARPLRAIGNYFKAGAEVVASDMINPALEKIGATKAGQKLSVRPIATRQLDQFRGLGGEGSTLTGRGTYETAEKLLGKKAVTNAAGEITGFKKVNPVVRLGRWLGKEAQKFNTAIEITPRYAEFKNAIAKGKTLEQALYDAAEITTNFSRGGATMKEADQYILYLNASVQGLTRLGRALNPLKPKQFISTLLKGGIAITLPQAILTELNKNNPYYKEIDNRIKDAYFLIPNPTDRDENGVPKTFIRIPRTRELGYLLGAFYDRVYRAASGDRGAWKGFRESALTAFAPTDPLKNNVISPMANVAANKDVFGRNIVPRSIESRSPHLQYDEKTTEPAKWIAQALYDVSGGETDVSPKVMDYLADSYLGIISDIGLPATTAQTYRGGKALESLGNIATRRFSADPLYSNQTITDFYDEIDKLETAAADRNFKEGLESGASTPEERKRSVLTKAAQEISKLSKELAQSDDPAALRRQMIQIAKDALAAVENMKGTRVYPAGVDDQKREAYDKIVDSGIPESKMQDIFKRFAELKPKPGNKTVTAADRKNMLWRMVKEGALTEKQYGVFVRNYYPGN
jgi:hypothetical protein